MSSLEIVERYPLTVGSIWFIMCKISEKQSRKSIKGEIFIDITIQFLQKAYGQEVIAFKKKYCCQERYPMGYTF